MGRTVSDELVKVVDHHDWVGLAAAEVKVPIVHVVLVNVHLYTAFQERSDVLPENFVGKAAMLTTVPQVLGKVEELAFSKKQNVDLFQKIQPSGGKKVEHTVVLHALVLGLGRAELFHVSWNLYAERIESNVLALKLLEVVLLEGLLPLDRFREQHLECKVECR